MADLIELAKLPDVAQEILIAARKSNDSVFVVSNQHGNCVLAGGRPLEGRSCATVVVMSL